MTMRRRAGIALLGTGLVVLSCSADRESVAVGADASTSAASADLLVGSSAAATRIAELRTRFHALGAPVATRFEAAPDAVHYVQAVLPAGALRGVPRPAHVALPVRAGDEVRLEDDTSHLSVRFALEHVQDARIEIAGGMAIYRGALDGADVVHRVHAEGTEDFVVFETRPAREELSYAVDVSQVPGLRLVSNTLEFLDATGTPALRVAPPYLVDAVGEHHDAKLAVDGCAYDTSPAGPWGRAVTAPGALRCTVRVAWGGGVAYPAMVDPVWGATGSMAAPRSYHTASVLLSGRVLIAGGYGAGTLASAELYDPAGNAGAGTFAATGSMGTARSYHTASVLPSGKVLVVGGVDSAAPFASAELYDPAGNAGAGTFTATGSMATTRRDHTASVLPSGKVLIAGGRNSVVPNFLASAELFDPSGNAGAGSFVATGSMASARYLHTASVLLSGKVLVAGGVDTVEAELYDPAANAGAGAFAATGSMAAAREGATASVLSSGKVLIVGGRNLVVPHLASAEVFDPTGNAGAGTFAATGSMGTARELHTASVLPSGNVLVAGGINGGNLAELYYPAGNAGAGNFAAASSMAASHTFHTASVLASGKVLIAGGSFTYTSELYEGPLAPGAPCTASGDCPAGFCVDGVCCDTACDGACLACSAALKFSAASDGTCGTSRDDAGAPCRLPGATCDGDHTTTAADGTKKDCAPYRCDANGTCRTKCTSVNDCAAPTICDPTGTCVPPASSASDGGCAISAVGGGGGDASLRLAWLAVVAGVVLVRRKRRRDAGLPVAR